METVKVVIVGGGAAGLAAAKTLGAQVDYLLLEGQGYLGGRIRTVDAAPNVVIDMGAQFIHGQANNVVYDICQQLDCILPQTEDTENDMLVVTSDRASISPEIMIKASAVWEELLLDARAKFGDRTVPTHYSFADYLLEHFRARLERALPSATHLLDALMNYFQKAELIEDGCDTLAKLSVAEYGSFEYLDGSYENQFKNGGYRPFIAYMKSFVPSETRIRLNCEVVGVRYLSDRQQLLVTVRQPDGTEISTIACEHMIWTSSLGFLKENFHSIFADEPDLIEQKQSAIDHLGFDTVNKVVVIYSQKFWPENIDEIILLQTQTHQSSELSIACRDLAERERIDAQRIKTIMESIHRYDVLPSTDVPVLVCWFGGSAAVLLEDLSDHLIGQVCHEVLCYYLNVSLTTDGPRRTLKSDWHRNRFTRGSYSYYSVTSPALDGERLRSAYAPDGIPRIQFAGEATHEKFYSTVHGAVESGIREGEKLLAILNQ